MITPIDGATAGAWRCPRCEADRAPEDDFCGRCGTPRLSPGTGVAPADDPDATSTGRLTLARALILNGIIVGAVLVAFVLGRAGGSPTTISFEPAAWRCDGTPRTWVATIPAAAIDVRVDWVTGGPAGQIRATSTTPRAALEPARQPDGSFRVTTTDVDAPECALDPGTYTLAIRDAASNALIASGTLELAP